jgi:ATP-dependent exoDNAse (exonuclease V) beta subunit
MTTSPILMDAAERECAENDLSNTYLIEAAAGTGKTTLLVRRILTIVRTTLTPLSRVVAITFTEKAAGELKIKLREKLEEGSRKGDEDSIRYGQALQDLDAMPVSTIHAFCRDLISQRPVEAQVDPGFAVCDDQAGRMLRDEAWNSWIQEQLSADCPAVMPFLRRHLSIGDQGGTTSLRSLFEQFNDYREHLDELHVQHRSEGELRVLWNDLLRDVREHVTLISQCRAADDTLYGELTKVQKWLTESEKSDFSGIMGQLVRWPKVSGNRKGKAQNWPPDVLDRLRQYFLTVFEQQLEALAVEMQSREAAPLVEWMKGGVRAYQQLKQERGLLDFHDLLIGARDMLKRSREARDYFKKRYDYLLVDEFQDTDPLQAEIVFFLAERSERFAENWYDVEVEFGKLFIVGDPKQSIYRFRRADLDLYGRVKQKIAETGKTLAIFMNFRSHPDILSEVNALFAPLMSGASGERYEPFYVRMEPAVVPADDFPALMMLPPPAALDSGATTAELAQMEAACIARYIEQLVHEERRCSYRDIGILYHTTTHLASLENALRANRIPYQVSGGKDLPRRSEIQALRTTLRAIDNPHDTMNVIGALRSPFFSCSDEELLQQRISGGGFDYTSAQSASPHVNECFRILRELYECRRTESPATVVSALLERTQGMQIFSLKPQGELRVANLLKVGDIARSFAGGGSHSLHRLVRWLDRLDELRVGEDDTISESGDDVVELSTFHKAKGLEFSVVFLYRLARDRDSAAPFSLINRTNHAVELSAGSQPTAGYAAAQQDDRDRQWHETIRLLYVAMTRARSLLVLPLYWSKDAAKGGSRSFLEILKQRYPVVETNLPAIDATSFRTQDTNGYDLAVPLQERFVLDTESTPDPEAIEVSLRQKAEWMTRRENAARSLIHEHEYLKPSGHVGQEDVAIRRVEYDEQEYGAAEFGSFVHRIMQRIHFPSGENMSQIVKSAAEEYSIPDPLQEEGRRLVTRVLQSPLFTGRILPSAELWRELEFTALVDGRIASGAVDLVFMDGASPVIVDYKTDRVMEADLERRAEFYTAQGAVYLKALEGITGLQVKEVLLVFLRPGAVVSLTRDRLLGLPIG